LRPLATAEPAFLAPPKPSRTQPLDAIRAGFEAGTVQTVFLGLSDLPALPEAILTEEEAARAQRLVAAPVRLGFIGGRWLMRSLLAVLAGVEPRSLVLQAGEHGKLSLVGHERLAVSFNLSHSGNLVGLALVHARRIGIDIEAERPLTDGALLARRILGPRERKRFERLPKAARAAALLAAWTRKEAVLKAMGIGISGGLDSIDVLSDAILCAGEPATSWVVRTLAMPPGYHGAVAIEGDAPRLRAWQAMPQEARSA